MGSKPINADFLKLIIEHNTIFAGTVVYVDIYSGVTFTIILCAIMSCSFLVKKLPSKKKNLHSTKGFPTSLWGNLLQAKHNMILMHTFSIHSSPPMTAGIA